MVFIVNQIAMSEQNSVWYTFIYELVKYQRGKSNVYVPTVYEIKYLFQCVFHHIYLDYLLVWQFIQYETICVPIVINMNLVVFDFFSPCY